MAEKEYIAKEFVIDAIEELKTKPMPKALLFDHLTKLIEIFPTENFAPVKHGHWVKEKSDVLTDTDKWIEQISNMIFDVNPAEIASHIQNGTLKEWCLRWQQEMNMLIITAPLDYSKEREDNG